MYQKPKTMQVGSVALWASLTSMTVLAQEDRSDLRLEEVVVTASKRGEMSAQSAPFSIQAIGNEDIERAQMQGFDDYAKLVPGLASLNKGPGQTQIMIRGITAGRVSHAEPQNQSTTGMYIDDMPVAVNGFNPDLALFDVERIEVLRGPQGTLYGAGAMSGAIRVITQPAKLDAFEGAVELMGSSITDGGEDYAVRGLFNAPIVEDQLALRASGYFQSNGGFIDNVYTGEDDYNSYDNKGGRVRALWKASDRLDVSASVIHQNLTADGRPQEFRADDPRVTAIAAPGESFAITGDHQVVKFVDDRFDDKLTLANLVFEYAFDSVNLVASSAYLERTLDNLLDDTYRTRLAFGAMLADGVTPIVSPFRNDSDIESFSQEIRLLSAPGGGVGWLVGVYYEDQSKLFTQDVVTSGLDALAASFGLPPSTAFGAQANSVFDGRQTVDQRQYAAFGELTWPLQSTLELTLGLRYFNYDQRLNLRYAGIANDGVTQKNSSTDEDGFTPKAQLAYKPDADKTFYVQAAKGFRLGGVTEPVPLSGVFGTNCGAELADRGLTSLPERFDSDSLWSYEVGAKTRWLDQRVVLNAAVYDIEWSDIQTNVFLPCGFITVVNAGKAQSRGGEVEVSAAVSSNWTVGFSGSYTRARLKEITAQYSARVGDRVPNVPEVLVTGMLQYQAPLGSSGKELFARGSTTYTGDSLTEFESIASAVRVPSSTTGDVTIGLTTDKWEVAAFVKNVGDERVIAGVDTDRRVPPTYSVTPPRTVGVSLRLTF